jgi:hypothetical protein
MYIPPLPFFRPRCHDAGPEAGGPEDGRASGRNRRPLRDRSGKPHRLVERRGGAVPYVTGDAPKGEATPLKTSSPTGARAYVTGPRGRTSFAPGASRKSGLPDLRTQWCRSRVNPRSVALHRSGGKQGEGFSRTPKLGPAKRWLQGWYECVSHLPASTRRHTRESGHPVATEIEMRQSPEYCVRAFAGTTPVMCR